jgi:PIN domain nuclease of toxin-antitoxin system
VLLLDTHALLWWLAGDTRFSAHARSAIEGASAVHVSAVSVWEIAIKTQLGKLPQGELLLAELPTVLARQGFQSLPMVDRDGHMAGLLPSHHRDPFDRMLVAQSLRLGLPLVSNDPAFVPYGVSLVW